jgi:magnesium transporter
MITVTLTNLEQLEQQVRRALETQDFDGLRQVLADRHAADVADVIDRLDEEDQLTVFRLLAPDQAAEVLDETSVEATRELIEQLLPDEAGDLLDRLPMDDVAEILSEDVPNRQQALLAAMEPDDAAEVRALLSYPPQSAGRLMTEKFVQVRAGMTADETIARLRRLDPEIENLNDLYVRPGAAACWRGLAAKGHHGAARAAAGRADEHPADHGDARYRSGGGGAAGLTV